jgi:hypothetical protein
MMDAPKCRDCRLAAFWFVGGYWRCREHAAAFLVSSPGRHSITLASPRSITTDDPTPAVEIAALRAEVEAEREKRRNETP